MHEAFWNGLFDVRWEEAPLVASSSVLANANFDHLGTAPVHPTRQSVRGRCHQR